MFRFFNKKDDSSAKSGPPGHRAAPSTAPAPLEDGGFFNLQPPPVAKQPLSGAVTSPAPPPPSSYARPTQLPGATSAYHQPPPPPAVHAHTLSSSYEAPPSAPLDMFGGMAIKNPVPVAAPPAGGSLFSGLDLAAGGLSASHEDMTSHHHHQPPSHGSGAVGDRRKSATRSFNYLDVAAAEATAAASTHSRTSSTASGGNASGGGGARSVPKVVKKKKTKSFRPGFGRQLSDESVAALQRGDLKEEDIVHATTATATADDSARPLPTNPTDLAHLLPPVGASSMLAGLTMHKSAAPAVHASTTSVLASLTVHTSAASASASPHSNDVSGSVLAGLNIHHKTRRESDPRSSNDTSASAPPERATSPPPPLPLPPVAAATIPEEKAVPPTPEERLLSTLRDFHASAESFRATVLKHADDEARILERKAQLAAQRAQYALDLRDVEAQQHHAAEVEDFERADALNATLSSVRHYITLTESDARKVDAELAAFAKQKERAFANQLRSTRGTLRELEKFREDQEAERAATRRAFRDFEAAETAQLQLEAARIDTELHHVSASLAHLAAEKAGIDATIDDQCKDEFVVRAQLRDEKAQVEDEVRALERALAAKRARVVEIQDAIDKADKDIDVVRTRYSRQLKRLADRDAGLRQTKSEVESDLEQLRAQKREFRDTLAGYEAALATFGTRIHAVRKETRAAALLAAVLEVQETRREQSLVRKKQQAAELSSLADAAAIAEQSFVMLRKQRDELDKSLAIHRNAIASAESLIPRLEQDKKAAAAQRNFKDAARLSKDIKALEKDRATAEEMVEVVEMELQDLAERIAKRAAESALKTDELKAVEKQLELVTLQELWKEAKHLRAAARRMDKLKSEGVAAASGVDFRSSALLLVQAELEACALQVDALERNGAAKNGADSGDGDADATAGGDSSSALEEIAAKLSELEAQIDKATENEEYELAARLDEKIEVLKRRQHSLAALAIVDAPVEATMPDDDDEEEEEEEQADEEAAADEDHRAQYEAVERNPHASSESVGTARASLPAQPPHANHDEQSVEELTGELAALHERIVQVEDDIDLATQNEEYDSAAAFDEELQELRAEQEEIQHLLAAASQRRSGSASSLTLAAEPPAASSTSSLFMGLGVKSPTLDVSATGATRKASNESAKTAGTDGSSIFGGLAVSGSASPRRLSKPPSPIETAVLSNDLAVEHVAPAAIAAAVVTDPANSPTASSVVGPDSFFGAHVSSPSPSPSPSLSPSVSMFGGLQLSASALPASSLSSPVHAAVAGEDAGLSVFNGLSISQTATDAVRAEETLEQHEPEEKTSDAELASQSVLSAEPTPTGSAMFAGLHVSVSSSTGHESQAQSRTGSSSSLIEDEHSTDSPMTIHELSDHAMMTDDESLGGSRASHASSFADISFSSTSLTTLTTTTTTATTTSVATAATTVASDSLFGGLSLMAAPPATLARAPDAETDGDAGDEAQQEL
ncbi:hypothetical protein PybrP1_006401 [[Pythium] brassicae (nom. inval.)]|nr:hypothetical protein PybrP1_006401 [[Pythium] brassicae (nom. inval.)]